jgi:hypothetical protein
MTDDPHDETSGRTVIVDLGKRSRKQVKRLKKGKGKLPAKIEDVTAQLVEAGEISADADVVIVTVERKADKPWRRLFRR